MEVLVTYDVATDTAEGRRRLRHAAKICLDFGQRVQKSVFECSVSDMQYEQLKQRLLECIEQETDSLRIYRLSGRREGFVEHYGVNESVDFDGPLVA